MAFGTKTIPVRRENLLPLLKLHLISPANDTHPYLVRRHVALAEAVPVSGDRVRPPGFLVPSHHSQETVLFCKGTGISFQGSM